MHLTTSSPAWRSVEARITDGGDAVPPYPGVREDLMIGSKVAFRELLY
jgi:hypothetical protein